MLRKTIILAGFAVLAAGCSTISEESCIAGTWESLGYEDGRNGESRGRFNKIAETCAKYGISANAAKYRIGYNQGLPLYCSYDKGFDHGEAGRSIKTECREINSIPYINGYDEGYVVYEIRKEYEGLVDAYDNRRAALEDVVYRLSDSALEDKERKRLRKKRRRLERELDDKRIDIRAFERIQDWPKRTLEKPDFGQSN
ncbi:MAG: DUF2799 domain-containing protein [Litorimonas sp.]